MTTKQSAKLDILAGVLEDAQDIIALAKGLKKYPVYEADRETMRSYADSILQAMIDLEVEATDVGKFESVASIWMDDCGYRFWKVEITDADGSTGTEAGNVAVWYGVW